MVLRPSLKRASSTRSTLNETLSKLDQGPLIPSTHMTFLQFSSRLKKSKSSRKNSKSLRNNNALSLKPCLKETTSRSTRHNRPTKTVTFCTHAKHDTIWTMVHNTRKVVDDRKKKRVWWTKEDIFDPTCLDAELFFPSGEQFLTMLHLGFETDPRKDDCYKALQEYTKSVNLDLNELQGMACVRDMEPMVNPLVYKRIKKHRRVVLAAQDVLSEEGYRIGSDRAVKFISSRSLKFSQTIELMTPRRATTRKGDVPRALSLRRAQSDKALSFQRALSDPSLVF